MRTSPQRTSTPPSPIKMEFETVIALPPRDHLEVAERVAASRQPRRGSPGRRSRANIDVTVEKTSRLACDLYHRRGQEGRRQSRATVCVMSHASAHHDVELCVALDGSCHSAALARQEVHVLHGVWIVAARTLLLGMTHPTVIGSLRYSASGLTSRPAALSLGDRFQRSPMSSRLRSSGPCGLHRIGATPLGPDRRHSRKRNPDKRPSLCRLTIWRVCRGPGRPKPAVATLPLRYDGQGARMTVVSCLDALGGL
jgi:hypothetical protein